MDANTIQKIIETEISADKIGLTKRLGFQQCLVEPTLIKMRVPQVRDGKTVDEGPLEGWLVFLESPSFPDHGYRIVASTDGQRFGLAIGSANDNLAFIGWHGTFLQALQGI